MPIAAEASQDSRGQWPSPGLCCLRHSPPQWCQQVLNGNRDPRNVLTQLPPDTLTDPASPPISKSCLDPETHLPPGHMGSAPGLRVSWDGSSRSSPRASSERWAQPPPQGTSQHTTLNSFQILRERSLLPPFYRVRNGGPERERVLGHQLRPTQALVLPAAFYSSTVARPSADASTTSTLPLRSLQALCTDRQAKGGGSRVSSPAHSGL